MNQSLFTSAVQQATKIYLVEAGVFGVEASTPPTPLDRTLIVTLHVLLLHTVPPQINMKLCAFRHPPGPGKRQSVPLPCSSLLVQHLHWIQLALYGYSLCSYGPYHNILSHGTKYIFSGKLLVHSFLQKQNCDQSELACGKVGAGEEMPNDSTVCLMCAQCYLLLCYVYSDRTVLCVSVA